MRWRFSRPTCPRRNSSRCWSPRAKKRALPKGVRLRLTVEVRNELPPFLSTIRFKTVWSRPGSSMQDGYFGKTWIFWAQLIACGVLASLSLILGPLFWTGAMKDARGAVRPEAGPPLVIVGGGLLAVAVLAIFNIRARVAPVIRCYRD